ncbi:BamA/TamA family outer membrane protein [Christiangramia sp. SM2212]|uniref:BamA/TamA family outer membrane protein n=1 Tax=Christiangramia sediminicola TaxID=3073267 RepID=A0ABU1EME5_9FLAO|nr:BamA/TamA family outer membrane protein [Christiangramia sp. SM2212]MDR5589556.1 BamA/TamA family outer membrane protein [Christiangramia sp. SM2212]
MKRLFAKILLFFLTFVLIISCNAVKRLDADQNLLVKNEIFDNDELVKDSRIYSQLYQEPNTRILNFPLSLHVYNLARPNIDSILSERFLENERKKNKLIGLLSKKQFDRYLRSRVEFNEWLKRTGEAPVIVSEEETKKSVNRLKSWYWNNGWFNVEADYKIYPIEDKEKRARVEYYVTPNTPYVLDSINTDITSKALDSLYELHKSESEIKSGVQYNTLDFNEERDRLSDLFRNNGVYNFDQEYISFDADTVDTNYKLNTTLIIKNQRNNVGDSVTRVPFKVHKISKVNIFTDYAYSKRNEAIVDSAFHEGYSLYSFEKMRYKPESISDAIFVKSGNIYSDTDRTRTYNRLNALRVFKYPDIQYTLDPADSTETDLVTNIFLSPLPKYSLGFDFDVSQSNIQEFGIGFGGSFLIRNIFGGLENLEFSGRGSIASSTDAAGSNNDNRFFDITEVGADMKLSLPRIFLPVNTEKIIPKYMSPFTNMSLGFSTQRNIGLDKQTFSGILNYSWKPSRKLSNSFDLLNIQYVRNLNTENYFNVYRNSFEELNDIARTSNFNFNDPDNTPTLEIPNEADEFIGYVISDDFPNTGLNLDDFLNVLDIYERKLRLTENNLIFASSYTYLWNTRESLYDKEFSRFRFKIETAGNVLSALSGIFDYDQNEQGKDKVLGVAFSQYVKTELDFIKHWDLGKDQVFAVRSFGGIAIPYGNATNIPITKTFFAGGPNDNRAWQAYDLGPGSSGSILEFNEANMKLAFNAEYRFGLIENFKGALFVDVGNIWNVLDSNNNENFVFEGFSDLKELAVGSGFGLRYDFNFFILRFDIGFKTHDPARPEGDRWFKEYNFNHAVYNVGINYPF